MIGLNVDPTYPEGTLSPAQLLKLGARGVRLVSGNNPALVRYVDALHQAGIRALAVIAQESQGYLLPNADIYQIGNEPDVTSGSSWTMTPDQYVEMFRIYRDTYPDFPMIAAGLASGNIDWWKQVGPRLKGCAAVAVHPYAKTAIQAQIMLRWYKAVRPDLALWISEWWRPDNEVVSFARMLRQEADAAFWFCANDAMVSGMGLLSA